ncbi:MAG: hypothetical protein ABIQ16_14940 [Polyangiaceae bacterium]
MSNFIVWQLRAAALAALVAACATGSNSGYGDAAAVLAGTVIGSGVNRSLTGDCWAVCSRGFACDRGKGTCVRAECEPECAQGEHCVIEQDGRFRCMDATGMGRIGASASNPPFSSASAGPASRNPTLDAGAAPPSSASGQ